MRCLQVTRLKLVLTPSVPRRDRVLGFSSPERQSHNWRDMMCAAVFQASRRKSMLIF